MSSGVICADEIRRENILIAVAACAALLTLIPVAASQLGMIDRLPDPPGSLFASEQITDSAAAHPFGVPDSMLGIASYCSTLALLRLGQERGVTRRWLAIKLIADGGAAAFNMMRQIAKFGKICSWCMGTVVCTAFMIVAGRRLIARELLP